MSLCVSGLTPDRLGPASHDASPVSPEPTTPGAQSPSHLHYHSKAQHRRFSMEVRSRGLEEQQWEEVNMTDRGLTGKVFTSGQAALTCYQAFLPHSQNG